MRLPYTIQEMKDRWRNALIFGALLTLILGGCTFPEETQEPGQETALPTLDSGGPTLGETGQPAEASLAQATPGPETQEDMAACPVEGQAAAMRSEAEPDWEQLNLQACYELQFDFSVDSPDYTGTARVTYLNLEDREVPDLVFRLYPNASRIYGGDLQVSEVRVDGSPVGPEVILSDRTGLRIPLEEPLLPGEALVAELDFSAGVPVDLSNQQGVYGIFNYDSSEEVLTLANGYPILAAREEGEWLADPVVGIGDAVVSEAAFYHVQVETPPGWQVVSTGVALEGPPSGGESSFEFTSGPVREFTLVASPNFVLDLAEVDGVQVRHWGLPGGEVRWEESLQAAVDSLVLFEDRFGPYPYRELDVVAVPLWLAAGVEYPGLILMRKELYGPGPERAPGLEYVVAHEVAHQWWYGLVGNNVLEHPWQDEGLASFSSLLYLEEYQPEAYAGTLRFYRQRVAEQEREGGDTGIDQPVEAFKDDPGAYSPVVYLKGSLFFEELRDRLGEEAFFSALISYYEQNQYGLPAPEALLSSFEQECACELDDLYQAWGAE